MSYTFANKPYTIPLAEDEKGILSKRTASLFGFFVMLAIAAMKFYTASESSGFTDVDIAALGAEIRAYLTRTHPTDQVQSLRLKRRDARHVDGEMVVRHDGRTIIMRCSATKPDRTHQKWSCAPR